MESNSLAGNVTIKHLQRAILLNTEGHGTHAATCDQVVLVNFSMTKQQIYLPIFFMNRYPYAKYEFRTKSDRLNGDQVTVTKLTACLSKMLSY